ncbi:2-hydroxyacylsphingosine 1-beta-galactosyltransferase-like isoform X2 [Lingula anatina]|uniref:UDP-glucuronosyltransferase n=1 Tax=Lingula anatina TaxID=7574 RepID=A0A1S3H3A0_LINAN|nr:2-hydroxyacylsphingosine 1-beta-galactosyltransferase-like isoform X2 [Lingula anatina]XP_023930325.1 2-hydroxyacylsphingosine 1-beta-galactosyltransferase-like isoform X2 [Lingula anatina]XP_023930326.1 2-hydroxyacylsphingosine 1-beta-galactosyltransferase-like isoform X2 [Lingula anatina]XP_023930327.1 2-hydroxyacylsphingosine 1-beta-galactosyltransferase-like isoform X2 [Lingula anatina]|eukprot:XP_013380610.1 2-hydroxyacylsphingosine 1-beta-galactosyltransferase-like isoform X2 [Lingula anatina]
MTRPSRIIPTIYLLTIVMATLFHSNQSLKILALPYSVCLSSNAINMEKLVTFLATNGHEITLYVQDTYNKSMTNTDFTKLNIKFIHFKSNGILNPGIPYCQNFYHVDGYVNASSYTEKVLIANQNYEYCNVMLADKTALRRLEEENFDLILLDVLDLCRFFLINHLSKPAIGLSSVTCMLPNTEVPCPPAYVPSTRLPYTNNMTFFQRVGNTVIQLLHLARTVWRFPQWENIRTKNNISGSLPFQDTFGLVTMKLIKSDPALDYPNPSTPNLVFIGSFFIETVKPLAEDLEDFMRSTDKHGVIVMSFGSQVKYFPARHGEMFAEAFARLPQKVIWRYQGSVPHNLGNNTKLLPWLPQNHLLGHSKTKLFVSHCGIGGVHGAAYYGVPIVAIPLARDQPYISQLISEHLKMGVSLDYTTLTSHDLYKAITEVLHNPKYRENAQRVSSRFRDQLVSSEEKILHTVSYVHKHDGAAHLKSGALMCTWYQHLLLDVIVFILMVLVAFFLCVWCLCKCVYNYCCGRWCTKSRRKEKAK